MHINNRISEVLSLILDKRERDGGYYGYTSENLRPNTKIQSVFVSSVVCRLLLESAELIKYTDYNLYKKIRKSTERTIALIEKNKKTQGTWNYFINRDDIRENSLPDDLDDTFNSLVALDLFDEDKTDSNTLLATMKILLAAERKLGKVSAYNTWITSIEDIDPVVQIITHKFLSRIRSVPRDFDSFLDQTLGRLKNHLPNSKYYKSQFYILMELSSVPRSNKYTNNFKKYLARVPSNILDSISYYQIKNNLRLLKKNELQKITKINYTNSKITPFYVERITKGHKEYCYSDVVILALYLRLLCSISISNNNLQLKDNIYKDLIASCKKELSVFDFNITELDKIIFEGHSPINHIINEFISWCKYLNFNLSNPDKAVYIREIAKYTYFGWIGYTISDSIVDEQISKKYLPIGNHFLFISSNILKDIIHSTCGGDLQLNKKVQNYICKIYEKLHISNYIEINFESKGTADVIYILENKAIAHSVGFLILYIKHKKYNLRDMNLILKCFQIQLSMRQLSDDIHDWKEDLEQNRITLPTFLLRHINKNEHESFVNENIMHKILYRLLESEQALNKILKKLSSTFSIESRTQIFDQSHKYTKGLKQAVNEIKFYKAVNG